MKKFNFRKVLDGLTAASSPPHPGGGGLGSGAGGGGGPAGGGGGGGGGGGRGGAADADIPETLTSDHFQICKTVRHGFPWQPTALAFDPVQKILAIGCRTGALRMYPFPKMKILTLKPNQKEELCPPSSISGRKNSQHFKSIFFI